MKCRLCKERPATRRNGGLFCERCYRKGLKTLKVVRLAFGLHPRYGIKDPPPIPFDEKRYRARVRGWLTKRRVEAGTNPA